MKKALIVISLIVLSFVIVNVTKALYSSNFLWDYYLNSKGFYFETDYDKSITVYNFWDGKDIGFKVLNYNIDKYTEDDISYEVSCISDVSCKINGEDIYKSTLNGGEKSFENVSISLDTQDEDIEIEIVIKSISPYKKTIKNKVLLHKEENIVGSFDYDFIEYDNYGTLNISNYYNQDKCFDVKWDNTNLKVEPTLIDVVSSDALGYINEFTKDVLKNETISIKFYNQGSGPISKSIFKISECLES